MLLSRNENRNYKDCSIAGFLRRFRDPSRVPRIENRVPRIRENGVSTSQTNRVPTGPYRVPNIFLKKPWHIVSLKTPKAVYAVSEQKYTAAGGDVQIT